MSGAPAPRPTAPASDPAPTLPPPAPGGTATPTPTQTLTHEQVPGHGHEDDPVIPWGAFRITNGAVTNVGGYRVSGAPARKQNGKLTMKLSIDGQQDQNDPKAKKREIDATPGDEIDVGKNRYKVIQVKPSPSDGRDSLFIAPTDTGY